MRENYLKRYCIPRFILGSVGNSAFDLFSKDAGTGPARCPLFIKFPLISNKHI
jgi:hypothetical protein